jgi:predicted nucleic acid-binding protein
LNFDEQSRRRISYAVNVCNFYKIILVSEASAKISARIYAKLRQRSITIGTSDLLIAGIALENDLTLITNNEKH